MKKALAIGLAAVMAVSMSAPVFAEDEGKGIAKEDLKVGHSQNHHIKLPVTDKLLTKR